MFIFKRSDNGEEIKTPENWSEVTLGFYIDFFDVVEDLNNKLQEEVDELEGDIGIMQIVTRYPNHFKKIVALLTGIDERVIDQLSFESLISFWSIASRFLKVPKQKKITRFKFDNEWYYMPKSKKDILGNEAPMSEATFGDTIEALQIESLDAKIINNKLSALPYQIAIMCRKKGESYDAEKIRMRAKKFKSLTMDVVWDISFFLTKQKVTLLSHILNYSKEGEMAKKT